MIFPEVRIFTHDVYNDYRGELWTIWKQDEYPSVNLEFNHDKISTSRKNVLRGLHGDNKSWKMVQCLQGELYFVIVDNRPESKFYKKWDSMILSDRKRQAVLIPPNFGNGFLVLSETSMFHYKYSYPGEYADIEQQFVIKWNDPTIGIHWPIDNPILQARDK